MHPSDPIIISSCGIYALCFPDGYLILTESIADACQVCTDLGLRQPPYWWPLVKTYDTQEQAERYVRAVRHAVGTAGSPLVRLSRNHTGKWQVTYNGFISSL
ncbi:MAG: hypothetical protein ACI351_07390 [Candidatus Avelusimicrobium sp.]|uniref:hypothetical protein n=1 Tax=Candidatus Avelusimicrobium sp. TaxID=3048833 RepID=UPI003F045C0E